MTSDRDCITERINAFYESISGPAGHDHDWHSLAALFAPGATILAYREDSTGAISTDAYVERLRASLADRDFYERGLDYRIEIHGDIAQVWSRYEASSGSSFKVISKRGTNLVHLVRVEGTWKIAGMIYQDD